VTSSWSFIRQLFCMCLRSWICLICLWFIVWCCQCFPRPFSVEL